MPTRSKDSRDRLLSSATSSAPDCFSVRLEALRARTGLHEQRSYVTYQSFVDAVLATDRAAEFEAARIVGRRMPRQAVLEMALDPMSAAAATGIPRPSELPT